MVDDGLSISNSLLPFAVFKWLVGRAGDQRKEFFLVQSLTMFACWVQPPIGRGWVLAVNVDHVSGGRINNPSVPQVGVRCSGHFYANLNREPEASMQGGSEIHALTADVLLVQFIG